MNLTVDLVAAVVDTVACVSVDECTCWVMRKVLLARISVIRAELRERPCIVCEAMFRYLDTFLHAFLVAVKLVSN